MQQFIDYLSLYKIDADLKNIVRDNPGIAFLLNSKIKLFYQRADMSLRCMYKGMAKIQQKYIQMDENQNPKRSDPDENGNTRWLFINSCTIDGVEYTGDEVEKKYSEELEEFMKTTTKVDY